MGGILGKALAGAGAAGYEVGVMAYRDQILQARDERLAELQSQRDQRMFSQQDAMQQRTQDFQAGQAQQDRDFRAGQTEKEQTWRSGESEKDRTFKSGETDKEIAARKVIVELQERGANARSGASRALQERELGLREREFGIKEKVANIELENAERVKALKAEFPTATPERQAQIRDEVHLISGKDKENFLPVPLKDEMGNVTGYQIFDKTRGKFVDQGAPAPKDAQKGERPPLSSFFKSADKPAPPTAPPANAPTAKPAAAPEKQVVNMERAGKGQYVVTFDNNTKGLVSGDEWDRKFILGDWK